jgi:hypothetical protein
MAAALSPTWLQGANGERYLYTPASVADAQCDRVEQGSRAKMPEKCDASCLAYIGRDRSVVRGVGETDASYAARCKTSIYDWHFAGLASGMIRTVLGYISPALPMARMVWASKGGTNLTQWVTAHDGAPLQTAPDSWSNLSSTPFFGDWTWDAIENRRRFWLILYVNATGTPWVTNGRAYGDGSKYGDGHLYGVGTITNAQAETLKTIVGQWKAAHSRCECLVVSLSTALFDPFYETDLPGANSTLPDGTWAKYGVNVAGNYQPARSASARYFGSIA